MARRRSYRLVTFCCFVILISAFSFGYYMNSTKDSGNNNSVIPDKQQNGSKNSLAKDVDAKRIAADNPNHEGGEGLLLENADTVEPVTNNPAKQRTAIDTKLIFKTNYEECGHEILNEETTTQDTVNLTEEELKEIYDEWRIVDFNSNQVILSKTLDGKCLNHYIVKVYEGKVGLFYQESSQNESSFIKFIDYINLEQLRQDDRDKIKNGILIDSDEELAQLIEDFNS